MGISSLGVGSSILTQDVLDQLRSADEEQLITPIDLDIANEEDKQKSFAAIQSNMDDFIDSINAVKDQTLFDGRTTSVSGSSVEVTAQANSDIQDFNITVDHLATKQIEQSGSFAAKDTAIASGTGSLNLNIDGQDFTIDYDSSTTLDDLKKAINTQAGDKVDATVVQIASGDYRLFISSVDTGSTQDITLTDNAGAGGTALGANYSKLTTDFDGAAVQTGIDNQFTFNGQTITRNSNTVDDLITGYSIKLVDTGSSDVSVTQDRDAIMSKIDDFVSQYNTTVSELTAQTHNSTDSSTRGIFSSESTIKRMQSAIEDMFNNISGGVGNMEEYGFDIAKDGTLSVDKDILNSKMDENASNVEAFFTGGDYLKDDNSTVTLNGAFSDFSTLIESYTSYNGTLDQFKDSLADNLSTLEDRKTAATDRLDNKYEILKKQYTAYDSMIAKLNNVSSMFTQLVNSSSSSSSSSSS